MATATAADVFSPIGTTISIVGGYPATFDAAGYAAETYTQIAIVENVGLPESSATVETFNDLETGEIIKIVTFIDAGQFTFDTCDAPSEDGQAIVLDYHNGSNARLPVSIKVAHSNGDTRYLSGKISGYAPKIDTLNRASFTIEVDKTMVYVAA